MRPSHPKISIITSVYNGAQNIDFCIKSILNQTYKNIEYIIVDGASTDNTMGIIDQNRAHIDVIISEPDYGIGDAMNKGIKAATGDYIIIIHSDDYLFNANTIEELVKQMTPADELILCDIWFGKENQPRKAKGLSWKTNFKTIYHQGAVCKRELFEKFGLFDSSVKVSMDYDFFLRIYRKGVRSKKINLTLSHMGENGVGSKRDWPSLKSRFKEDMMIHFRHSNTFKLWLLYCIYWPTYITYRYIRALFHNKKK